jgi:hypothetical protein
MKRPRLRILIPASLILLLVYLVPASMPAFMPAAAPHFEPGRAENGGEPTSLDEAPLLPMSLPDTSNQGAAALIGRVNGRIETGPENTADLANFIKRVSDGRPEMVRGVYAPGLFSLPIIQQPDHNPIFVSNKHDRVTQFGSAARNGITGLLAHNYLAGGLFYKLAPGQPILIVYGNGATQRYQVVSIHRFQKLNPARLRSNLVDLSSGEELAAVEVFRRFYRGQHRLVFQTCLERNGRLDWGFLFVEAVWMGGNW